MRIAIIGSPSIDSFGFHIHDELVFQGYESKIFDFSKYFSRRVEGGLELISTNYYLLKNEKLLSQVIEYTPNLVICVYNHLAPFVVTKIKQSGIKIIHLNPDSFSTLGNQQIFAESFDFYFSKDSYTVDFMRKKLNLNAFHYFESFNPRFHVRINNDFKELERKVNIDVLCFGNFYPYRARMLKLLKDNGIHITLFGCGSKYFLEELHPFFRNQSLLIDKKSEIINGSKIVFNNFHYAEICSVNNKFFEINGAGGFQICDYKPVLKELLPFDPKLVSFSSIDEGIDLVKFYLNNPDKRWELRNLTYDYFLENFTYKDMIHNIFSIIL